MKKIFSTDVQRKSYCGIGRRPIGLRIILLGQVFQNCPSGRMKQKEMQPRLQELGINYSSSFVSKRVREWSNAGLIFWQEGSWRLAEAPTQTNVQHFSEGVNHVIE